MSSLTPEQLNRMRVNIEPGSRVLCLVCLGKARIKIDWNKLKIPECQLPDFYDCMVVPDEDWNCPKCTRSLVDGTGKGCCPCCGESRIAKRKKWTYTVDCPCVKTAKQRETDARAAQAREAYYDREERPAREREAARLAQEEEAKAKAGLRSKASLCLADMPKSGCTYPANNLPFGEMCRACPRFDRAAPPAPVNRKGSLEQPQPKVSTPVRDHAWDSRPGWKDKVQMQDAVADSFGDW